MRGIRLQTEYLRDPMGIDIPCPRLFWNCEGGVRQTAYQIIARCDGKVIWNSGKVISSQMAGISFGGKLRSRMKVDWSLKLWDDKNESGEISEASFEMGLLKKSEWKAHWITGSYRIDRSKRYPVDCFRRRFNIESIAKARLYVTACGLYEGCLNGSRIGHFVLAPGHTDYRKRIQYQTYDVTAQLHPGENELTFQLADGWFRGSCGAWGLKNQYGIETKLLVQLEITGEDGQVTKILSDDQWDWSADGPIRFADNKDGEIYDANLKPSYSGKAKLTSCEVIPTASNNVPITEHEHFTPELIITPSGKTVLDFHQNIAGYVSFSLSASQGQVLKLRFGEMLDAQSEFTQDNIQCVSKKIRTPLQEIIYTCKEGQNDYKTRFAIFGFQYVLVETDVSFKPEDFTAIAVYSDLETTAALDTSNELLNRFFLATLWSTKNNSADVPTDCPTRERHGWTGDSQMFCTTANYLMNYYPFARKHLRDLTDWQRKDGAFPQIAPAGGVDAYMNTLNGSVGWADAGVLIPYRLYRQYNDKQILEDHYEAMQRYVAFMIHRIGRSTPLSHPLGLSHEDRCWAVNVGQSYGEWAEPADVFPNDWKDIVLPHPEVSTAYTAWILDHMVRIAKVLDKEDDATYYSSIHEKVRHSYIALRHTAKFSLDTDRQALLVRPLAMNLLDEEDAKAAKARLIQALENYQWRLGTGFLSTPLILYVLSAFDLEAAYRLLENEEIPGWLSMPRHGATTIWESWEGPHAQGGIASLDHYSKGACLEWVFSTLCGIQVDGENHFRLSPQPGGHFDHANFTYQSIFGSVTVNWKKRGNGYEYSIHVPANCTATIQLPGFPVLEAESGDYHYVQD